MKKIVSLLLVLAMMMALAACGASQPAETQAPATEAPVVEAPSTEAPETEAPEASENASTQAPTVKVDTVGRRNRTFLVIARVLGGLVGVGTVISMIPGKNT